MLEGEGETWLDGGNDFLDAASAGSAQFANGGTGNDTMDAGIGDDSIYGDDDDDRVTGGEGSDALYGGDGNDQLWGERGAGATGGGLHDDTLYGNHGNDTLYGESDQDLLYGASGSDQLFGGDAQDVLYGGTSSDTLQGGAGDDDLYGGTGRDQLAGGGGHDVLQGDAGADTFQFLLDPAGGTNVVNITDFAVASDQLALSSAVFAAVGASVGRGELVIGLAAQDGSDHLIYDPASGNLSYDADGRGGAAAQLVAHLQPGLSLTAGDFTVI